MLKVRDSIERGVLVAVALGLLYLTYDMVSPAGLALSSVLLYATVVASTGLAAYSISGKGPNRE